MEEKSTKWKPGKYILSGRVTGVVNLHIPQCLICCVPDGSITGFDSYSRFDQVQEGTFREPISGSWTSTEVIMNGSRNVEEEESMTLQVRRMGKNFTGMSEIGAWDGHIRSEIPCDPIETNLRTGSYFLNGTFQTQTSPFYSVAFTLDVDLLSGGKLVGSCWLPGCAAANVVGSWEPTGLSLTFSSTDGLLFGLKKITLPELFISSPMLRCELKMVGGNQLVGSLQAFSDQTVPSSLSSPLVAGFHIDWFALTILFPIHCHQ
eukprot:Lithocolla_globosa_v1_NODE_222_length_5054_cov_15.686337.p2 type:complete len:262 gc:universal NODE_222_length_5054_cov_15.686337:4793-4008(-)